MSNQSMYTLHSDVKVLICIYQNPEISINGAGGFKSNISKIENFLKYAKLTKLITISVTRV